jgi:hypothetical protein
MWWGFYLVRLETVFGVGFCSQPFVIGVNYRGQIASLRGG